MPEGGALGRSLVPASASMTRRAGGGRYAGAEAPLIRGHSHDVALARAPREGGLALPRSLARADAAVADVAFAAFLSVVVAVRWTVVRPLSLPTGADGGNWLALGGALGSGHPMPGGVVYPPLVPALALIAETLGKPVAGLKLLAVVASVAPALGCYAAARVAGLRWRAAIPCAFLAVAVSVGEAAAWGGYPQLLGLGLTPLALVLLERALRSWRSGHALLAGLALAAALSANEMVGAVVALAAGLLGVLYLFVLGYRPPSRGRGLAVLGLVVAPALPLAPTYAQLLAATFATRGARPVHGDIAVRDVLPYVFRDVPALWFPMLALALAVPGAALVSRRSRLWPATFALLLSTAVLFVGLRQVRFGYVMPVTAVLALATWMDDLADASARWLRMAALAAAVGLVPVLAYQSLSSVRLFRAQAGFYQVVPGDWVPVMRFLRDDTATDSLVAVGPDDRWDPTGWWVQGLGQRPALIASDPAWLNFPGERARARTSAWIFDPSVSAPESLRRARGSGVTYLLVDKRWSHYGAWRGDGSSLRVVVEEPDVVLVRV